MWVKQRGQDYVEIEATNVVNGHGLKRAAIAEVFVTDRPAPVDVKLFLVEGAGPLPTEAEESDAAYFDPRRHIGPNMYGKSFLLVKGSQGELVRGELAFLPLLPALDHARSFAMQRRGDCCSITFWCRSNQTMERWQTITLVLLVAFVSVLAKGPWV